MMESAGLVLDALGRVREMVRDALTDLSREQLLAPPKPSRISATSHPRYPAHERGQLHAAMLGKSNISAD